VCFHQTLLEAILLTECNPKIPELLFNHLNLFICELLLQPEVCFCKDDVNSNEATLHKSTGSTGGSSSAGEFCDFLSATTFDVPATSCSIRFAIVIVIESYTSLPSSLSTPRATKIFLISRLFALTNILVSNNIVTTEFLQNKQIFSVRITGINLQAVLQGPFFFAAA
jgi:hypothetical protein